MPKNGKDPEKTLGAVRDLLINPDGPPLHAMAVLGGPARSAAAMIVAGGGGDRRRHHGERPRAYEISR